MKYRSHRGELAESYVMATYKEYPKPIVVGMSDSNTFKEAEHG